jgi:hypothetical protein
LQEGDNDDENDEEQHEEDNDKEGIALCLWLYNSILCLFIGCNFSSSTHNLPSLLTKWNHKQDTNEVQGISNVIEFS